jgi:hypothetical protein
MRRQSRLALGALVLVSTLGFSGAASVASASTATARNLAPVEQSVSQHRSPESAVVAVDTRRRQATDTLRPAYGALPTHGTLVPGAWALLGIIVALAFAVRPGSVARGRSPPLRFL